MKYRITVNFGGFIGCGNGYVVDAESRDDAIEEALEMAFDDLSVEEVEEVDYDEEEED